MSLALDYINSFPSTFPSSLIHKILNMRPRHPVAELLANETLELMISKMKKKGKTYLFNTLLADFRSRGCIVIELERLPVHFFVTSSGKIIANRRPSHPVYWGSGTGIQNQNYSLRNDRAFFYI